MHQRRLLALSSTLAIIMPLLLTVGAGAAPAMTSSGDFAYTTYKLAHIQATSSYQNGYSPVQIKGAYSLNGTSTGSGKTIAIVDAYDDPTAANDFDVFSTQFGLPTIAGGCNCFSKVDQTGGTNYPRTNSGWALEISLDIEWAHAIAPQAHILLVEANSNSFANLLAAEGYATAHAQVVSNSWGGSEFSSETSSSYDGHFNKSVAITVSAGDSGTPADYPSASPYVVSTVAHFGRQRWTKAVFAAPFPLSLSAILQHSSRLEKRVTTERAYRLNRAPVGPARAPPL